MKKNNIIILLLLMFSSIISFSQDNNSDEDMGEKIAKGIGGTIAAAGTAGIVDVLTKNPYFGWVAGGTAIPFGEKAGADSYNYLKDKAKSGLNSYNDLITNHDTGFIEPIFLGLLFKNKIKVLFLKFIL